MAVNPLHEVKAVARIAATRMKRNRKPTTKYAGDSSEPLFVEGWELERWEHSGHESFTGAAGDWEERGDLAMLVLTHNGQLYCWRSGRVKYGPGRPGGARIEVVCSLGKATRYELKAFSPNRAFSGLIELIDRLDPPN